MAEQFCTVGDIDLCYETFGDPEAPAVLLIMGLGTQMLAWHEAFCTQMADRGFHVIRFDNRDIGRSGRFEGAPVPSLAQLLRRDGSIAAYTLEDLADDGVGLLDQLGVERAHVVGASMGGMIAQTLVIRHPERATSLVSIMSNTGAFWTGQPSLKVLPMFLRPAPRDRAGYLEHQAWVMDLIGSPGFEPNHEELRRFAEMSYERGVNPAAGGRQLAAIFASGDRTDKLRDIRVPALVVHGTADKLISPSGGRATAAAIPDSRLLMIDGMGHDLPRGTWPQILDAFEDNAARAGAPAQA